MKLNLSASEQRVLGVLMEKSKTTPEYYPLTLNGLVVACNQKTSRKPIVNYQDQIVIEAIDSLKKKNLVSTVVGGGSRTIKYKHNFAIQYPLVPAEIAVLCLLLLRGAMTSGEINNASARLYEFESLEEVNSLLEKLALPEDAYIQQLPKRAGQKESRYIHLLGEVPLEEEPQLSSSATNEALEERVRILEEELALLRSEFNALMDELK